MQGLHGIALSVAKNELALRTLDELASFGLAAIPEHYVVWYRYLEGRDRTLTEVIKNRLAEKQPINSLFILGLFDQYCYRGDQSPEDIGAAMHSLETDSSGLLQLASEMSGSAGKFGASINAAVSSLSHEEANESALCDLMRELIENCAETEKQNQLIRNQIKSVVENISETRSLLEHIGENDNTDPLTKLINHRGFRQLLEDNAALAVESKTPLCLIICGIDRFKNFNATFGNQAGDQTLVHIANALKRNIKGSDILARLHGDEFAAALPETSMDDAMTVADALRASVENCKLMSRRTGKELAKLTISLGVAEFQPHTTYDVMFDEACANLNEAKGNGGNLVFPKLEARAEKRA